MLGENGAGKTTLMNVLAGVYLPDEGTVSLDGAAQHFNKPADAIAAGVGMVHQEFRLIPTFTVAENVVLGAAPALVAKRAIEDEVADLAQRFGLATEPGRQIWQLSMGERQRVEILKALWRDAKVLILDEPTAVLTPNEAAELGRITSAMAADGRSIIFISHKLDEVKEFCDEATVLRGGKTVAGSLSVADLDAAAMAELMVGQATDVSQRRTRTSAIGKQVCSVSDVVVHDLHQRAVVDGVSLAVAEGEIVGIAGVAGNGQRPLADAIAGLVKLSAGKVTVAGQDLSDSQPSARNAAGLAYVPEDRIGVGLAPKMNVTENAMMRAYRSLSSGSLIDRDKARANGERLVAEFNVKVGQMDSPIAALSGGNLQRLLVGRELDNEPKILIAAQPTRGLDVQGVAAIQRILLAQAAEGLGILLISEDLEELFALSDRLLVMHKGKVVKEVDPDIATRNEVGQAMAGA